MYNDFVIVGPPGDPAGIKGMKRPQKPSKEFRRKRSLSSAGETDPEPMWQRWSSGKRRGSNLRAPGMYIYEKGAEGNVPTLRYTDQDGGLYRYRPGHCPPLRRQIKLVVLVEKDEALLNLYILIPVNPKKFPKVNYDRHDDLC